MCPPGPLSQGQAGTVEAKNTDNLGLAQAAASAAAAAKLLQSCLTLCDPTDGSPPGSPAPGILQARTLEWVAISLSSAGKWKGKVKSLSHVQPAATPWIAVFQATPSMGFFQARVLEWVAIAFSVKHIKNRLIQLSFELSFFLGYLNNPQSFFLQIKDAIFLFCRDDVK